MQSEGLARRVVHRVSKAAVQERTAAQVPPLTMSGLTEATAEMELLEASHDSLTSFFKPMTRSQQTHRRSELIAQLGDIAAELAALDALTFQRYTVTADVGASVSSINGLSYSGDLKACLEADGMEGLTLPPDNDQRRVVIDASEPPAPLLCATPDIGADGEPCEGMIYAEWGLVWW